MKKYTTIILTSSLLFSCQGMVFPSCLVDPCVLVPGKTRADNITKSAAAADAFQNIKRYNPACGSYIDYTVIDTKVDHYGQWKYGPSWQESWTIEACGIKWLVPVDLSADGAGHTNVGTRAPARLIDGKWTQVKPANLKKYK